jgi:hypothetical protein
LKRVARYAPRAGKLYNAVQLQPCNGSSDQDWLIRRESGWIRLVNVNGGECLDIIMQGNQKGMAHVARCGDYQGQRWKMD